PESGADADHARRSSIRAADPSPANLADIPFPGWRKILRCAPAEHNDGWAVRLYGMAVLQKTDRKYHLFVAACGVTRIFQFTPRVELAARVVYFFSRSPNPLPAS